ncbi:MAG TPA: hypothetical protein VMR97_13190 [Acidimicrobiales bacterium]|nr:hypothetical protein [Acidimicrobiales bacterium]
MRRTVWLSAGVALGAGGTLWARRRLEVVSRRMHSGELTGDVAAIVDRQARRATRRLRRAVEAGRDQAKRREDQLWRELEVSARAR